MFKFGSQFLLSVQGTIDGFLVRGSESKWKSASVRSSLCRLLHASSAVEDNNKVIRSDLSLTIPDVSFWELMEDRMKRHGDNVAMECAKTHSKLRYGELLEQAEQLSSGFQERGLEKGDVVATCLFNCVEAAVIILALARAGIILAPINPSLTSGEISRLLNLTEAKLVITEQSVLPEVKGSLNTSASVDNIILKKSSRGEGYESLSEYMMPSSRAHPPVHINPCEDTLFRNCSSGTTGPPKVVELTHKNEVSNIVQLAKKNEHWKRKNTGSQRQVYFNPMPLFHIGGLSCGQLDGFYCGDTMISLPCFTSNDVIAVFKNYQINSMFAVPPMLQFLVTCDDITKEELWPMYYIAYGAAPTGETTLKQLKEKSNPEIICNELYGLTECIATHSSVNLLASIGTVMPETEAMMMDLETGKPLGPNEEGELCIRGPQVMKGYFNNPEATRETTRNGWLLTGDVGYYTPENQFYMTGRRKEIMKVKGLQVAPAELENLLRDHPSVEDVAVVGVPDDRAGELPRAFIVKRDSDLTAKHVEEFLYPKIAAYKRLHGGIHFTDQIPKSPSGKILRRLLQ